MVFNSGKESWSTLLLRRLTCKSLGTCASLHLLARQQGQKGLFLRYHFQCHLAAIVDVTHDIHHARPSSSIHPIHGTACRAHVRLPDAAVAHFWRREELHLYTRSGEAVVWSGQGGLPAQRLWHCIQTCFGSSGTRNFERIWIFKCMGYERTGSTTRR